MAAATEAYALTNTSLAKIQRWLAAKKAAGQTVQPWELESAYEAELNTLKGQQTANRSLSLQAARDADNVRLREEEIAAGKDASTMGAIGNLGTTALMTNYMMKGPDVVKEGVTTAGKTPIGNLGSYIYDKMGKGYDVAKTALTPTKTTLAVPAESTSATQSPAAIAQKIDAAEAISPGVGAGVAGGSVMAGTPLAAYEAGAEGAGIATTGNLMEGGWAPSMAEGGTGGGATATTPLSTYTGVASTGYLAPKLLNAVHKDSTENLGHNLSLGLIKNESGARTVGHIGTGAAAGAAAGTYIFPGVGTAAGAVLGAIGGAISDSCIIISYIYGKESKEAQIARRFCARHMEINTLLGYYQVADVLVKLVRKYLILRPLLVSLVAEPLLKGMLYKLGKRPETNKLLLLYGRAFLGICRLINHLRPQGFRPVEYLNCVRLIVDRKARGV